MSSARSLGRILEIDASNDKSDDVRSYSELKAESTE